MSDNLAVKTFDTWIAQNPTGSKAVAGVHALTAVIDSQHFGAASECISTLRATIKVLTELHPESIALGIALNIYFRYVTRVDWTTDTINEEIRSRAHGFCASVMHCRDLIYSCSSSFIRDDQTILVHGNSVVVTATLVRATAEGKHFKVYVTEGRPACDGYVLADRLRAAGIPVTLIADTAVGTVLPEVDRVLCGAEAVDENGGVVNKAGTCQIAIACSALSKPFYVLCESYKFMREFLLSQADVANLAPEPPKLELFTTAPSAQNIVGLPTVAPIWDYTHPRYITLLFTDLGTLAPSAVSDELFKLYY